MAEPTVKITYTVEMTRSDDPSPKPFDRDDARLERMMLPCPEFNKMLHTVIGYDYRWGGRTEWTEADWLAYVTRPGLETWVLYVSGTPAGYYEIELEPEGAAHIHNFGLLPDFVGQGLGGPLLTTAIERAWSLGATRLYLRTCSHDHPHALKNYLARGFKLVKTEEGPPNPPLTSYWELLTGTG